MSHRCGIREHGDHTQQKQSAQSKAQNAVEWGMLVDIAHTISVLLSMWRMGFYADVQMDIICTTNKTIIT